MTLCYFTNLYYIWSMFLSRRRTGSCILQGQFLETSSLLENILIVHRNFISLFNPPFDNRLIGELKLGLTNEF